MKEKNDQLAKTSGKTSGNIMTSTSLLPDIPILEAFIDSVADSSLFNAPFKIKNPLTEEYSIDKASMLATVVLGTEIGLTAMASLMMGKLLNKDSYYSVMRGNALGLDPITSISKIYNISTANGNVISLAVDVISKVLLDAGCTLDYIRDYEYTRTYKDLTSGMYAGHYYNLADNDGKLKDKYLIYKTGTTAEEVTAAVEEDKLILQEYGATFVTSLRITRSKNGKIIFDNVFHYSIQEAIDADLHQGFSTHKKDAKGKAIWVKGKSNWNNHPATMTKNRVTSISGRIAVADKLQGTYSHEEAMEIKGVNSESELIQDAEIIKES